MFIDTKSVPKLNKLPHFVQLDIRAAPFCAAFRSQYGIYLYIPQILLMAYKLHIGYTRFSLIFSIFVLRLTLCLF